MYLLSALQPARCRRNGSASAEQICNKYSLIDWRDVCMCIAQFSDSLNAERGVAGKKKKKNTPKTKIWVSLMISKMSKCIFLLIWDEARYKQVVLFQNRSEICMPPPMDLKRTEGAGMSWNATGLLSAAHQLESRLINTEDLFLLQVGFTIRARGTEARWRPTANKRQVRLF